MFNILIVPNSRQWRYLFVWPVVDDLEYLRWTIVFMILFDVSGAEITLFVFKET